MFQATSALFLAQFIEMGPQRTDKNSRAGVDHPLGHKAR